MLKHLILTLSNDAEECRLCIHVLDPQGVECTGPLDLLVMVFKRDRESRIAVFMEIVQRIFFLN